MSKIAIKAEGLSKAYQLGEIGTGTISRDLERWWAKMRGKEDPFLRIGETNERSGGANDIVWSLKDLNFEIEQGDAVGIIGRNGAGKSTLLKILSRVTSPTSGSIKVKGRIASLLEVGTGFHPELTGRENIFLNGAILGMRKTEIKRKFDEIVAFSGVERYIDTPVKRYSSGMYVRLAFAVAAHLESEILIVDEVLAVGDAEFQKKCLGKMGDISKGEGRTVLFVSHNISSIKELCTQGILLENGAMRKNGEMENVIGTYLNLSNGISNYNIQSTPINSKGYFQRIRLYDSNGDNVNTFIGSTEAYILIEYELLSACDNFNVGMIVYDAYGTMIYASADTDLNPELLATKSKGTYKIKVPLPLYNLNTGNYVIKFLIGIINIELFDSVELVFSIEHENFINTGVRSGLLISMNQWKYLN